MTRTTTALGAPVFRPARSFMDIATGAERVERVRYDPRNDPELEAIVPYAGKKDGSDDQK